MPNIDVLDMQGKKVGSMELSEEIFASPINVPAMHLVVRSILANQRQGTQSALTRGMVRGGGRKIYRQKGTGNARHHGNRAPQFRHGGVVFAPQPRDYVIKVPKKVRRLAMKSALTSKYNEGSIIVVDEIKLQESKTKLMAQVLKALNVSEQKALLVLADRDESVIRARGHAGPPGGVRMKNPHDIILRPVLTEKGYDGIADKRYVFEVAIDANKIEIKTALEKVFPEIKVARVNTLRTLGKMKRQGVHTGRTPEVKKAYVILAEDSKPIEFFEGMV